MLPLSLLLSSALKTFWSQKFLKTIEVLFRHARRVTTSSNSTEDAYEQEVTVWKNKIKNLSKDEVKPPPPLNLDQRAFARDHLRAQRLLVRARTSGASKLEALQLLKDANLRQIQLLQGAGGVGKSVLLKAMKQAMQRCTAHW